jgi:aldose sugar dehydrogenase
VCALARLIGLFVALIAACSYAAAQTATNDYARLCSGCHGDRFRSTSGSDVAGRSETDLAAVIRSGISVKGMPAFGAQLSEAQIEGLAQLIRTPVASVRVGVSVSATTLDRAHSAGYVIMSTERQPPTRFAGYFSERSSLCYADVDLTGARSVELTYARGDDDPARFAILIGDGKQTPRINLGEKAAISTGGWEDFEQIRVGLNQEVTGPHLLCFYGVQGGGIFNLESFALSERPGEHDGVTLRFEAASESAITAGGYQFVLEKVAQAASELWSMAFLPDGSILAAQKNGVLTLFKDGNSASNIEGIPEVWNGGQGGLLAVKPHPNYASNGWIYLTFSDPGPGNVSSMTRVVRGKLDGLRWVNQQDIYRAPEKFYTQNYAHFGSRIAFVDDYIYFSLGERQQAALAQDLSSPYGKIHRLHDDGRVPKDNPFIDRPGALPSIWSYGHRNPQGMTTHPHTSAIWSAEHGPAGGDEINVLRRGANYGWPLVSFGTHYDGRPVSDSPYLDGVEPPIHHFTPSIAVSQIEFYRGNRFPEWQNQLLVASLGREELHLLRMRDQQVLEDRLLFKGFGRIRDVVIGPDGYPYVLLNQFAAGIYRLRPTTSAKRSDERS